ncbi:MAG: hypothetical protein H6613_03445 [Ignavibacteriales bacterium]|nr:hypothetical protein [Ignavibacteriales bacterium]
MKLKILILLSIISINIICSQTEIDSIAFIAVSDTTFFTYYNDSVNVQVKLSINEESPNIIRKIDFITDNNSFNIQSILDTSSIGLIYFDAKFIDLTFDGNLDIIIMEPLIRTIELYRIYIYDPTSKRFSLCKTCDELKGYISIDSLNQKVISEYSWAYSHQGGAVKIILLLRLGNWIWTAHIWTPLSGMKKKRRVGIKAI